MNPHQDGAWQLGTVNQDPGSLGLTMVPTNLDLLTSEALPVSAYSTQDIAFSQSGAGASQLMQDGRLFSSQNDGASITFDLPMSFRDRHRLLDGIYNSHSNPAALSATDLKIISHRASLCMEEVLSWFEDEKERRERLNTGKTSQSPAGGSQFPPSPAETTTPPQNSTVTLCMSQCAFSPTDAVPFSPPARPSALLTSCEKRPPLPTTAKRGRPSKKQIADICQTPKSPESKRQKRIVEKYPCPDCKNIYSAERWLDHFRRVHFPDTVWECRQLHPKTRKPCAFTAIKPCPRADNFGNHLKSEHGCDDDEVARLKESSSYRVFNFFHQKCGFCGDTLASRDESIDHIKNHLKKISQRDSVPADLGISEWREQCGAEHILTKGIHYGFDEDTESLDAPSDDDNDDGNNGNGGGPSQDSADNDQDQSHGKSDGAPGWGGGTGENRRPNSHEDSGLYPNQEHGFMIYEQSPTAAALDSRHMPSHPTHLKSNGDNTHSSFGLEGFTLPFISVRKLGSGGHGSVDEVATAASKEHFVRKSVVRRRPALSPSSDMTHLKNELSILKELSHPNLVKLIGAYTDDEYSHIIMSPVADQNLADFMSSAPLDPPRHVLRWRGELSSAMAYLHSRCVKHLDVKPQNILVKGEQLLLADFGTAESFFDRPTDGIKTLAVTPMYCAPETILYGRQDYSADIFSLGCVFAELLTYSVGRTIREFEEFRSKDGSKAFHMTLEKTQFWIHQLLTAATFSTSPNRQAQGLWGYKLSAMLIERPDIRPSAQELHDLFTAQEQENLYGMNKSVFPHITNCSLDDSPECVQGEGNGAIQIVASPSSPINIDLSPPFKRSRDQAVDDYAEIGWRKHPRQQGQEYTKEKSSIFDETENDAGGHTTYPGARCHASDPFDRTCSTAPSDVVPSLYSGSSSAPDSEMFEMGSRWSYMESPCSSTGHCVPADNSTGWNLSLSSYPSIASYDYSSGPSIRSTEYPSPSLTLDGSQFDLKEFTSNLYPRYLDNITENSILTPIPYLSAPYFAQNPPSSVAAPGYKSRGYNTKHHMSTNLPRISDLFHPTYSRSYSPELERERGRCTFPDCGKVFKDLKAHMLTHEHQRPEKCPIQTCDYHLKGFARKYDKNRHTLTHFKGNMVCGFCPGGGSAAERSFNRADVFKRHLTSVHGVEMSPPNSRKKVPSASKGWKTKQLTGYAPDATGKCSTCSSTFTNAQEFYEHLDDCVLRIVQQECPSEAINAARLAEVESDPAVHETLRKNALPTTPTTVYPIPVSDDEDEDDMDDESDYELSMRTRARRGRHNRNTLVASQSSLSRTSGSDTFLQNTSNSACEPANWALCGLRESKGAQLQGENPLPQITAASFNGDEDDVEMDDDGNASTSSKYQLPPINTLTGVQTTRLLNHSKGGATLNTTRKKRKQYPSSWGCSSSQMKMRKRIMCIFDGPRRLSKDTMTLSDDHEVRTRLAGDANAFVTDLDVQLMRRADAFHKGTEEEKGPWVVNDLTGTDLEGLREVPGE